MQIGDCESLTCRYDPPDFSVRFCTWRASVSEWDQVIQQYIKSDLVSDWPLFEYQKAKEKEKMSEELINAIGNIKS